MRIVIVSDTHERHRDLGVLEGDVLIHCGDGQEQIGTYPEIVRDLDDWFEQQRFEHILAIGGNHDFALQAEVRAGRAPFRNAELLLDSGCEVGGVRFWGAPWTPTLVGWAFYASSEELERAWSRVPTDTDVLITHTPPAGILDRSSRGHAVGCRHLKTAVERVQPVLHCFGHVHHSGGTEKRGQTLFANAAIQSRDGGREPVVLDLTGNAPHLLQPSHTQA